MDAESRLSRRTLLADLGRGLFAIAVLGVAGCGPAASGSAPPPGSPSTAPASAAPSGSPGSGSPAPGAVAWHRVNLGSVSAYLLVRGGEAAVVDTGVAGSEGDIEAALVAAGLAWDAVGHVIVTHLHGDHAGSLTAVLEAAADAQGYAGAEDLAGISAPRPLVPVMDGDTVFGLRVVATPGHTPGHVAVLDEVGGILVAGDALTASGGRAAGPNERFTDDMDQAMASVAKLGNLAFETLLVGHGDPVTPGASAQVRALAGR